MHIQKLRIRNFRSIDDVTISLERFTTLCGANSCGKSNVFRAILLAFQRSVSIDDAQSNLPRSKLVAGGPLLSIWVDCEFADVPVAVQNLVNGTTPTLSYSFRLTRGGSVTRKLGQNTLTEGDFERLLEVFMPVYVPPIRDLNGDGLLPFKRLIKAALQRAKGPGNIRQVSEAARKLLEKKAEALLDQQTASAKRILDATRFSLDTDALDIEALYEDIGLRVHSGGSAQPLSSLGTGHQSAVIMHLYRQLGEDMPGEVMYLFEEPDNHLHPTTIRSICDDLREISKTSQVLVTTHSPIFLSHIGFGPLRPLTQDAAGGTGLRKISLLNRYTEKQARASLDSFGIRLTEPLLSKRVIVVEGPTDRTVLATLFERRRGKTTDQDNLLVIAAGSKSRVVDLVCLLHTLSVDWRCVLDRDAALSSEVPFTREGLEGAEIAAAQAAVDALTAALDTSRRRGSSVAKTLAAVRLELAFGRPETQLLDNSPLKKLVTETGTLTVTEQGQLKQAMASGRQRESRRLFDKGRSFVWSGCLEDVLLHNSAAEDCVEGALLGVNELSSALSGPARRATLANKLHGLGNMPEVLGVVVNALEDGGHFRRTEMNACYWHVFDAPPA